VKLLLRSGVETLYCCFDGDTAGQRAADSAVALLQRMSEEGKLSTPMQVRCIQLPTNAAGQQQDPDDYLKAHGEAGFRQLMQQAEDGFGLSL
jgi:DNA primase